MENFSEDYVCFSRQPPIEEKRSAKVVLWPVYIWQVFGPDLSVETVNVFERAILSLLSLNRGRWDRSRLPELADWLGLEAEMIEYIIEQQLEPKGWIDARTKSITPEGNEALQTEVVNSNSLRAGYVFQDAVDGSFLPRFSNTVDWLEPENRDPLRFSLNRATTYKHRPTVIASSKYASPPSVADLHNVMEAHSAAQRNAWLSNDSDSFDSQRQLDSLVLSNQEPIPAYLWVWIYPVSAVDHIWAAADPFTLHEDVSWMREKIEAVSRRYKGLENDIRSLLGDIAQGSDESLDTLTVARTEQAKELVSAKYPWASGVAGLENTLYGWLARRLDIEDSDDSSLFHDYRDLITQSGALVELCVRDCLSKYPLKNPRIIKRDWDSRDIRRALANSVPSLTPQQLNEANTISSGKLFNTAIGRNGAFRTYLATILLSFPDYNDHPLRGIVNDEQLFLSAYQLTDWRNKAAHLDQSFDASKESSLKAASIAERFLESFHQGLKNV